MKFIKKILLLIFLKKEKMILISSMSCNQNKKLAWEF